MQQIKKIKINMKKFLIIFGSFILFLISIGTMFKLQHWPGAGPILFLGMFFFSAVFLPLFLIQRLINDKSVLNITTNIFGLFSTSLLFLGVLFKTMNWPGAGPMIVFGAAFFIFPTLILYMILQFKEYDRKFSEFWRTITLGVLVCVFLIFWGSNVSRSMLYSYLKVDDATLETNKNLMEYNDYILQEIRKKYINDAVYSNTAENINNQTMQINQYVEDIKKELIQYAERDARAVENHWYINAKDNYDIPTHFIGTAKSKTGIELFTRLNNFKIVLKGQMLKLPFENKDLVESLGDFGINTSLKPEMTEGYDLTWNEGMFNQQILVGTLSLLSSIQNEILNAEFKCLKSISMNENKI